MSIKQLTEAEINRMRDEVATPEILPCEFDVTIPGWLERIKLWGMIKIYHKNPENFRGKKKVSINQFLDGISGSCSGKWSVKKRGLTKVTFHRTYIGRDGRFYVEQFFVNAKLRKELR